MIDVTVTREKEKSGSDKSSLTTPNALPAISSAVCPKSKYHHFVDEAHWYSQPQAVIQPLGYKYVYDGIEAQ